MQLAIATQASSVVAMLSTNDNNTYNAAGTKLFWSDVTTTLLQTVANLRFIVIAVAPAAPNANNTLAVMQAYANGQISLDDGKKVFVVGANLMKEFSDASTGASYGYYNGTAWVTANIVGNTLSVADTTWSAAGIKSPNPGPVITTDSLHPNDLGHYKYALAIAHGILAGEAANSNTSTGSGVKRLTQ